MISASMCLFHAFVTILVTTVLTILCHAGRKTATSRHATTNNNSTLVPEESAAPPPVRSAPATAPAAINCPKPVPVTLGRPSKTVESETVEEHTILKTEDYNPIWERLHEEERQKKLAAKQKIKVSKDSEDPTQLDASV